MKLLGENFTVIHVIYQSAYLNVPLTIGYLFKKVKISETKRIAHFYLLFIGHFYYTPL